jgi:hypothetical protein
MDKKIKKIIKENQKEERDLKNLLREDKIHDKIIDRAKKTMGRKK